MREVCADTGVNITQGKQVQRQVRYERLKEEFTKLIDKLGSKASQQPLRTTRKTDDETERKIKDLEETLQEERQDFQKKLKLYKDQVKRMRENIDLF